MRLAATCAAVMYLVAMQYICLPWKVLLPGLSACRKSPSRTKLLHEHIMVRLAGSVPGIRGWLLTVVFSPSAFETVLVMHRPGPIVTATQQTQVVASRSMKM